MEEERRESERGRERELRDEEEEALGNVEGESSIFLSVSGRQLSRIWKLFFFFFWNHYSVLPLQCSFFYYYLLLLLLLKLDFLCLGRGDFVFLFWNRSYPDQFPMQRRSWVTAFIF